MENELKILSAKVDKVLKQQELILEALKMKDVVDYGMRAKLSRQEIKAIREKEIKSPIYGVAAMRNHKIRLQAEFNLKVPPHPSRIKAYLITNDPSVFDNLKRNE